GLLFHPPLGLARPREERPASRALSSARWDGSARSARFGDRKPCDISFLDLPGSVRLDDDVLTHADRRGRAGKSFRHIEDGNIERMLGGRSRSLDDRVACEV